jgi:hypothetical protein
MNAPFRKSSTRRQPDREQIVAAAYHLYLEYGSRDGHDLEHWLRAAEELLTEGLARQQEETAAVSTPLQAGVRVISRPADPSKRAPVRVPATQFERSPGRRQATVSRLPFRQEVAAAV